MSYASTAYQTYIMAFMVRKAAHPHGGEIIFHAKYHTYKVNGQQYKSVSTILGQYFPFDAKGVSEKLGLQRGQDPEEIRKEWKMTAVLGSNVHAHIEALLEKRHMMPPKEKQGLEEKFYPVATKAVEAITREYDILGVEQMIASKKYEVAGTIDLLARHKKTGRILIGDWKTSQTPNSEWAFSAFDAPALHPISHLSNSKMTKYSLQTLIYGYILKTEGYESLFGSAVTDKPMEHGLVKLSLRADKEAVDCSFHAVKPHLLNPPDHGGLERSIEDVLCEIMRKK